MVIEMKLISTELIKYKRLALSAPECFKIMPQQEVQLILGTNGSGKSSVMRELVGLPAEPADYEKGGGKIQHIEHKGSQYITRSVFDGTGHSFVKDGIELNRGSTRAEQLDLVREHFRLTPEIRDLITGAPNMRFHSMSPIKRRELFTQMSDVDYTYALGYYTRAKNRVRDISGAITMLKKRLVSETAKVESPETIALLTRQTHEIHKTLTTLFESREKAESVLAVKSETETTLNVLGNVADRILGMDLKAAYDQPVASMAELTARLETVQQQYAAQHALLASKSQDYERVHKEVELLQQSGGAAVSDLKALIDRLQTEIGQLKARLSHAWDFENIGDAVRAWRVIFDDLREIFTELPNNENRDYSNAALKRLREENERLNHRREDLIVQSRKLLARREHLEHHQKAGPTVCPKCEYQWVVGYNELEHSEVVKKLDGIEQELGQITRSFNTNENRLQELLKFFETYRRYLAYVSSQRALQSLWSVTEADQMAFTHPKRVLGVLEAFDRDVPALEIIHHHVLEIDKTMLMIGALSQADEKELVTSNQRLEVIHEEIHTLTTKLQATQTEITALQDHRRRLTTAFELADRLKEAYKQLGGQQHELQRATAQEIISELITSHQRELAFQEERLATVSTQAGLVEDLKMQIEQLQVDEIAAKTILKEISPTEGLIAQGLMGFINSFAHQMNQVIARVWTYPLEILPCAVSEDNGAELDYRFPIRVGHLPDPIPDANKGSTGIMEIVDLAFKIVAMKYLGLNDSMLFLDEFGASFDDAHRAKAMQVITSIIEQADFPQLFIVSHYEASYGALRNVDICVLNDANIIIPAQYNHHVVIS